MFEIKELYNVEIMGWGNDDTRSEVLRRGKSVSVSVSVIRIRAKLPLRTKFTYV